MSGNRLNIMGSMGDNGRQCITVWRKGIHKVKPKLKSTELLFAPGSTKIDPALLIARFRFRKTSMGFLEA